MDVHFPEPQSLKEKRVLLKSLTDRIRQQFNVSVSEIDGMDLWQRSTLAIAAVGSQTKFINGVLDRIADFVRSQHRLEVTRQELEFF